MQIILESIKSEFFKQLGLDGRSYDIRINAGTAEELRKIETEARMLEDDRDKFDSYGFTIYRGSSAYVYINSTIGSFAIKQTCFHELTHVISRDKKQKIIEEYIENIGDKQYIAPLISTLELMDEINAEYTARLLTRTEQNLQEALQDIQEAASGLCDGISLDCLYMVIATWLAVFPNENENILGEYISSNESLIHLLCNMKDKFQILFDKYYPNNIWEASDDDIYDLAALYIDLQLLSDTLS